MKKLKHLQNKIPRPCRAVCNLVFSLAIAAVFYVCIDSPAFSQAHQFRRAERAGLVGPSTILFNDKIDKYDYSNLIVGETEHGVLTYATDDGLQSFNYFKKTGDITVISAPKGFFTWGSEYWEVDLPVFVIDDHPEAVRAELALSVKGTFEYNHNMEHIVQPLDQHFSDEAEREHDGIFCFTFNLPFIDPLDKYGTWLDVGHGADGFALDALSHAFTNKGLRDFEGIITAIVRLYDESSKLIIERELLLDPGSRYWE